MSNAIRGRSRLAGPIESKSSIYPKSISNLLAWFDATQISGSDNDPIGTWADLSGNGYDATQGTEANKPLLKTNIINGNKVVRFDGSNDVLVTGNIPFGNSPSLFAVFQYLAVGSDPGFLCNGNSSSTVGYTFYRSTSTDKFVYWGAGVSITTYPIETPTLIAHKNTALNARNKKNGVPDFTYNGSRTIGTTTLKIASNLASAGITYPNIDFGEIIIYSSDLSEDDTRAIESYLMNKWGIA